MCKFSCAINIIKDWDGFIVFSVCKFS